MTTKQTYFELALVALLVFSTMVTVTMAQTTPRNGSQLGVQQDQAQDGSADGMQRGNGAVTADYVDDDSDDDGVDDATVTNQDRDQMRDRMMTDDPDQDRTRLQDQDKLQDGTGDNCIGDQDCDGVPDQDRDRDRVQTPDELRQFIQDRQQDRDQAQDGTGDKMQTRSQAQVATEAVMAAERMLGTRGPRMSEVAEEMNQAMNGLANREDALQNRSRVRLFFFGQDDDVVAEMEQTMAQNHDRIQEMKQYMLECEDCDQAATEMLVEQVQTMEREQTRLQSVVDDAAGRQGLFGFLFGWLR